MEPNQKQVFDSQTDIHEIAKIIAYVDQTILADREAKILSADYFNSTLSGAFSTQDDFDFYIICGKSGARIGQISNDEYKEIRNILGSEKAIQIIRRRQLTYISHKWICTDDKALANLAIYDPIGYFVYAASKILTINNPARERPSNAWQDMIASDTAWLRAKHALWVNIQQMPLSELIHSNEVMRRFLAVINPSHAHKVLDFFEFNLSNLHEQMDRWRESVSSNLANVIKRAIKSGKIKAKLTYDDIIILRNIYKGNSNFALQKKLRKRSMTDAILDDLQDLLPETTARQTTIHPALPIAQMEKEYQKTKQITKSISHQHARKNGNIRPLTGAFTIKLKGD